MRALAYVFSAAADGQPLTIDRDCELSSFAMGRNVVISTSSADTIANTITTPTPGGLSKPNVLAVMVASTGQQQFVHYNLLAGEKIFLSSSGAGTLVLFFADVTPSP